MFFKTLPADWPSLHNKCNNASCTYPNNPQPAPGRYNCRGCKKGSYVVTSSMAKEVDARCRRVFDDGKQNQRREEIAQKQRAREHQEREAAAQQQQQHAFLEQKCREEAAHQQRALLEQQRREEAANQDRALLEQQRRDDAAHQQRSRKKIAQHNRTLEAHDQRTMKQAAEMGDSMWADYERRLQVQRTLEQRSQMGEPSYQGPSLYECQTSPRTEARRAKLAERPDASLARQGAYRRQNSAGDSSRGHGVSRAASPAQGGYACVQPRTAAYHPHSVGVERPVFFRVANQ